MNNDELLRLIKTRYRNAEISPVPAIDTTQTKKAQPQARSPELSTLARNMAAAPTAAQEPVRDDQQQDVQLIRIVKDATQPNQAPTTIVVNNQGIIGEQG